VYDAGQSIVALGHAKKLLLFEDGAQTVADRRLETSEMAQLGI
jgi:hypothetical protein